MAHGVENGVRNSLWLIDLHALMNMNLRWINTLAVLLIFRELTLKLCSP